MTIYKGKITGDLTLNKGDDATEVTSIGGSLYVRPGATAELAALTSIGGYLDVSPGATAELAALTSIGGYLYVSPGATAELAALTSIGGYPIPEPDAVQARMRAIAEQVVSAPETLNMEVWHDESKGCGTTHCIAGWAVHLEPGGYDLEKKVGSTLLAGNILLGPDASRLFFTDNGTALAAMQKVLAGEPLFAATDLA